MVRIGGEARAPAAYALRELEENFLPRDDDGSTIRYDMRGGSSTERCTLSVARTGCAGVDLRWNRSEVESLEDSESPMAAPSLSLDG